MAALKNELGQPIGFSITGWKPSLYPRGVTLHGRYCRVERLNPDVHAVDLHNANSLDTEHRIWTYLAYGPFESAQAYRNWVSVACRGDDPMFYAIVDKGSNRALGVASYLRVNPTDGVIEVGHINYSPLLQKTIMASEAMYLMMKHVFDDLNYRRYEWKCDALNAPSRQAAKRFGFSFEGVFRQATMYKNRNRDTAWFSIIDLEWPSLNHAYQQWLAPDNFNNGKQRRSLSSFMPVARQDET